MARGGDPVQVGGRAASAMECLLAPRSIAFVGVSARGGAGAKMLRSARQSGFAGPIWPVNPNAGKIEALTCVASLDALPEAPDCLVVSVPADAVLPVLNEAAEIGIRAALVVSEGFSDAGTEEGNARQQRLVEIARRTGMAVAGPNCMGIASLDYRFAATMADIPERLPAGGVSLVSQSGGLLNAAAELSANRGIGMNYLVSIGNQAVLELADYLDFLSEDPGTEVIACIMEGAKDGRRFRAAVERAARRKPLVVLKLGRSEAGQAATLAHTGTLAGRHEAYAALFGRNGVASVRSLDELVETAGLLASAPYPVGNGVCLLTVSGGATSLIGDLGDSAGLAFPPLSDETSARVGEALGVERAFTNPLDSVGMPRLRKEGALDGVMAALLDDPAIDLIGLVLGMRRDGAQSHNLLVDRLAEIAAKAPKPVVLVSFISNSLTARWRDYAVSKRLTILEDLELGLRALRHLVDYAAFRRRPEPRQSAVSEVGPLDVAERADGALSEAASKLILAAAGLPVTRELVAETPEEAAACATQIGGPVAIKVLSPDIPHKSDVGGVHLGATAADAKEAAQYVLQNAGRACPVAKIEGVLVQEMVEDATEFFLGMNYDPQFGPLIVVGAGGVLVEVFKDVSVRLAPVDASEAETMLAELKASKLLGGVRGGPPRDRAALIDCLVKFSEFAAATDGQFAAIDLNPVFVRREGQGVLIADALILTKRKREESDESFEALASYA